METTTAPALTSGEMLMVSSARRNLREVLSHPAFTKDRRQQAEALIGSNTNAAQLMRWKVLALKESECWEDAKLKKEDQQLCPATRAARNN